VAEGAFLTLAHVLMFTAMAALMLARVQEYTGRHHDQPAPARP
jgi:hypothetical protein